MNNEKILIFGGTGSLGYELNGRYKDTHILYNFSRDEHKHWKMKLHYKSHPNIRFIIGNVADQHSVEQAILRVQPTVILIASAMKHIDQCELNTGECMRTNVIGVQNIVNAIECHENVLQSLTCVVFISSDKACSPVNMYGLCKAMSEGCIIEKSHYMKNIRFINVRYGNVLNSSGSILPLLHTIGQNNEYKTFTLTSDKMTRFVMTLEQSVNLIEYAILHGESGDTIIPKLVSMKLIDLFELFSEKYNKPIVITGVRPGEKLLESLINETQSGRIVKQGEYIHIRSVFRDIISEEPVQDYNSTLNTLTRDELRQYLVHLQLL
jgi:UDP-glucose 4-epimerase